MTKAEAGAFATVAVLAAAMAGTLLLQNSTHRKLLEENALLQHRADSATSGNSQSKPATGEGSILSSDLMDELIRLRGEVSTLRVKTNELGLLYSNLKRATQAPPGSVSAPRAASLGATIYIPRDTLAFAGYADPESAFQSAVSAFTTGDLKTLLSSVSPEEAQNLEKDFTGKTPDEIAAVANQELNGITAFRVLDKQMVSEDEAVLTIYAEGRADNPLETMRFTRINGEWKVVGGHKN
jgi:hypothetical protein